MSKAGIIGTGHVGSQVLTEVIHLGLFIEITVIDTVDKLAEGEALDRHRAEVFHHMNDVNIKGGAIQDLHNADLIIIAAGQSLPKESEKPDRTLLTASNTKMIREIMRELVKVTTEAFSLR